MTHDRESVLAQQAMQDCADDGTHSCGLSEEHEGQRDDDSCYGALTHGDHLTHVDGDLNVGRSRSDDGAIGSARRVRVAVYRLARLKR